MNITHFKSALTAHDILLNIFYNHSFAPFYTFARFGTLERHYPEFYNTKKQPHYDMPPVK